MAGFREPIGRKEREVEGLGYADFRIPDLREIPSSDCIDKDICKL